MGALPSRESNEDPSSVFFANCSSHVVFHIPLTDHYVPSAECLAFSQLFHARNTQSALYCFDLRDVSAVLPASIAEAFHEAQEEEWGGEVDEADPSIHYYDEEIEAKVEEGKHGGKSPSEEDGDALPPSTPRHVGRHLRPSIEDRHELYRVLVTNPMKDTLVDTDAAMCKLYEQERQWRAAVHHHFSQRPRPHEVVDGEAPVQKKGEEEAKSNEASPAGSPLPRPPSKFLYPLPQAIAVRMTTEEEEEMRAAYCRQHGIAYVAPVFRAVGPVSSRDGPDAMTGNAARATVATPGTAGAAAVVGTSLSSSTSSSPSPVASPPLVERRRYHFEDDPSYRDGRVHLVEEQGVLYHFAYFPRQPSSPAASRKKPQSIRRQGEESSNGVDANTACATTAMKHTSIILGRCLHDVVYGDRPQQTPSVTPGAGGGGAKPSPFTFAPSSSSEGGEPELGTPLRSGWCTRCGERVEQRMDYTRLRCLHSTRAARRAGSHLATTAGPSCEAAGGRGGATREACAIGDSTSSDEAATLTECVDEEDEEEFIINIAPVRIVGVDGLLPSTARGTPWLRGYEKAASTAEDAYIEQLARKPPVMRVCRFIEGAVGDKMVNRAALVTMLTYQPMCRHAGLPESLTRPVWSLCVLSNIPHLQMVRETYFRAKAAVAEVDGGDRLLRDWLDMVDRENNFYNFINANLSMMRNFVPPERVVRQRELTDEAPGAGAAGLSRSFARDSGRVAVGNGDHSLTIATSPLAQQPVPVGEAGEWLAAAQDGAAAVPTRETAATGMTGTPTGRSEATRDPPHTRHSPGGDVGGIGGREESRREGHLGPELRSHPLVRTWEAATIGRPEGHGPRDPVENDEEEEAELRPTAEEDERVPASSSNEAPCDTAQTGGSTASSPTTSAAVGKGRLDVERRSDTATIKSEKSREVPRRPDFQLFSSRLEPHAPKSLYTLFDDDIATEQAATRTVTQLAAAVAAGRLDGRPRDSRAAGRADRRDPTNCSTVSSGAERCAEPATSLTGQEPCETVSQEAPPLSRALYECGMVATTRGRHFLFLLREDCLRAILSYSAAAAAPIFIGAYIEPVDTTSVSYGGAVRLHKPSAFHIPPEPHEGSDATASGTAVMEAGSSESPVALRPRDGAHVVIAPVEGLAVMAKYYHSEGILTCFSVADVDHAAPGPTKQHRLRKLASPLLSNHSESSPVDGDTASTALLAALQKREQQQHGHVYTYVAEEFREGDLVVYNFEEHRWEHYEQVQLRRRYAAKAAADGTGPTIPQNGTNSASSAAADDVANGVAGRPCSLVDASLSVRLLCVGLDELVLSWTKWIVDNRFYEDRNDVGWLSLPDGSPVPMGGRYFMWSFRHNNQRYFYGVIPKFAKGRMRRQKMIERLRRKKRKGEESVGGTPRVEAAPPATFLLGPGEDETPLAPTPVERSSASPMALQAELSFPRQQQPKLVVPLSRVGQGTPADTSRSTADATAVHSPDATLPRTEPGERRAQPYRSSEQPVHHRSSLPPPIPTAEARQASAASSPSRPCAVVPVEQSSGHTHPWQYLRPPLVRCSHGNGDADDISGGCDAFGPTAAAAGAEVGSPPSPTRCQPPVAAAMVGNDAVPYGHCAPLLGPPPRAPGSTAGSPLEGTSALVSASLVTASQGPRYYHEYGGNTFIQDGKQYENEYYPPLPPDTPFRPVTVITKFRPLPHANPGRGGIPAFFRFWGPAGEPTVRTAANTRQPSSLQPASMTVATPPYTSSAVLSTSLRPSLGRLTRPSPLRYPSTAPIQVLGTVSADGNASSTINVHVRRRGFAISPLVSPALANTPSSLGPALPIGGAAAPGGGESSGNGSFVTQHAHGARAFAATPAQDRSPFILEPSFGVSQQLDDFEEPDSLSPTSLLPANLINEGSKTKGVSVLRVADDVYMQREAFRWNPYACSKWTTPEEGGAPWSQP